MNNVHDHELSAYLDNELPAARRTELETALANDPALQRRLQQLQAGNEAARRYFSALDEQPLPQGLEALIQNARPQPAELHPFLARRQQPWLWATAASVLLATGLWWLQPATPDTLSAPLARILDTQPSGSVTELNPQLRIEVLASYRQADGRVCRDLLRHTPQASTQLTACADAGEWQLHSQTDDGVYQTASGQDIPVARLTASEEQHWLEQRSTGQQAGQPSVN